jgi:predicted AlkP superfamily phosphohydrolase/phosphomutase
MGPARRVVAIGLDGLELSYAERLMADGCLPALAALRDRSAELVLDHGPAGRTGLAWEHFASARTPDEAQRWAAVEFDPSTYEAWQEGARFTPFFDELDDVRTVVFDPPYVDLARAPRTQGVVAWGAHDPGAPFATRPAELADELGAYPSPQATYAIPWASAAQCRATGDALVAGLEARREAAVRLLATTSPEWDLFLVVAGEIHSGVEALWHGIDPTHPLHDHASATAAGEGLRAVHVALDRLVAAVVDAAGPDVTVVAFAMGGMGRNESDIPSMVLLPELLHRHRFGTPLLRVPEAWAAATDAGPLLAADESWSAALARCYTVDAPVGGLRAAARRLPAPVRAGLGTAVATAVGASHRVRRFATARSHPPAAMPPTPPAVVAPTRPPITWMPASRYREHWPAMAAFALPSFYDGRVRINLVGRERDGVVALGDHERTCAEVEALVRECRDVRTGDEVVAEVERPSTRDPLALSSSEADLVIVWRGVANGFVHPTLGRIGPVPYRRTGGHTGPHGVAYVAGPDVAPGRHGVASSFVVAPLVRDLLAGRDFDPGAVVAGAAAAADPARPLRTS